MKLEWNQAPTKTQWGHDMVETCLEIDKDHTLSLYCERDQTEQVEAMLNKGDSMKADDIQAGGTHYKDMGVQPWTVMEALLTPEEFRGYLKGNLIKYAMRQGKKDSPDADKWHHYKLKLKELTG